MRTGLRGGSGPERLELPVTRQLVRSPRTRTRESRAEQETVASQKPNEEKKNF